MFGSDHVGCYSEAMDDVLHEELGFSKIRRARYIF